MKFDKVFAVDTNVLLHDPDAFFRLSENGKNLILITETVLKEIDKFKLGYNEINFHAREISRKLGSFNLIKKFDFGAFLQKDDVYCFLTNDNYIIKTYLEDYKIDNNDTLIILSVHKCLELLKQNNALEYNSFSFITNDIVFRLKAHVRGYQADYYRTDFFESEISFDLTIENYEKQLPNKTYITIEDIEKFGNVKINNHINVLKIRDITGKLYVFVRDSETQFKQVNINRKFYYHNIAPRTLEQQILWYDVVNTNWDIYVIDAIAGTGKTLTALLCSLELLKKNKVKDPKITYIRKTIISGSKHDELGFLPGDLNDKMFGYILPLRDNIEFIIKSNMKKKELKDLTQEELEEKINNFENMHNINYEYMGHLRGRNLSGIIILDECQNFSIKDLNVILSRITDGSRVFIIGSTKQIDNPYLNKYNNSLSFMLHQCGYHKINKDKIIIKGAKLQDVHRGKITEWIESITKNMHK